jgi:hypothetical protein
MSVAEYQDEGKERCRWTKIRNARVIVEVSWIRRSRQARRNDSCCFDALKPELGSSKVTKAPKRAGASNMAAHHPVGITMGNMARHLEAIVLILAAEYASAVIAMTVPTAVA